MREDMLKLLEDKAFIELSKLLRDMEPADVADMLSEAQKEEMPILFRLLPKELAAEAFVEMDGGEQEHLIQAFSDAELKAVLNKLYLDDTVDIIEEMPANVIKRILKHTAPGTRKMINQILKYPKDSAGSIMTIEYVRLWEAMTVAEAFKRIRETGVNKETIYTCYVTKRDRTLIGIVTAKTLFLSPQDSLIKDVMETNCICLDTIEDQEQVVKMFQKYNFLAMPVVDKEHRLVGIVTVDDVMDVLQEETEEDFEIMAAMNPSDESYFKTSIWMHARNRILWLLFLMLSASVTGSIISKYEKAFEAIPLLVSFIPMIMGTGGNCGSQSSTMIIRGLALDEIRMKDFFKATFKEARIALVVGSILALVNGVRIVIMYHSIMIAIVLGLTLIATVTLSKFLGCALPMFAKRFKLDPAIMAAPLISTVVDSFSVFIYFNIALRILDVAK